MDYTVVDDVHNPRISGQDPRIKGVMYNPKWVPIGRSGRGRDYLCLDLDPSNEGEVGQVILTAIDSDAHLLIADSFTAFLSVYFRELQSGEILLEDE